MKLMTRIIFLILFLTVNTDSQIVSDLDLNKYGQDLIVNLEKTVPELIEKAEIPGLSIAVIRDGKIVWQKGFGVKSLITGSAVSEKTVFEAASLSKPVFAYAVIQIIDKGILDLDTPLIEYVPEKMIEQRIVNHTFSKECFRIDWFRKITARMVLSHSSGMTRRIPRQPFPLLFEPGTGFKYSAEGFEFLQLVVEHITGKKIDDIMNEYVFEPLQMNESSFTWGNKFENDSAVGHDMIGGTTGKAKKIRQGNAAASLYTTAGDYAKFMLAIMKGTRLKERTSQEMLTPQVKVEKLAYGEPKSAQNVFWGLGIGLEKTDIGDAFWHWGDSGTFRNYAVGFKDREMGVVYLTNSFHGLSIARDIVHSAIGGTEPGLHWLNYLQYDSAPLTLVHMALKKGTDEIDELFPGIKDSHPDGYNEFMLNAYTYELLRLNKVEESLVIFKHLVQSFPESSVLYCSLGEASVKNGDNELAIKSLQKALELDPNNHKAKQILTELNK